MRTRMIRPAVIVTAAGMLLLAGCQPRDGGSSEGTTAATPPVATEPAARLTHSGLADENDAALPDGFRWVGGKENGLRLGVPAEWVEVPPQSGDLAERHGLTAIDPAGARDTARYQAHLVASCGPDQGITTGEQLESSATFAHGGGQNLVTEAVTIDGTHLVRSEFDEEAPNGTPEHWYVYDFLASGGRLCSVTLTTPLQGRQRRAIDTIFEQIGATIEPLDPNHATSAPTPPVDTDPGAGLTPPTQPNGSEDPFQPAIAPCELLTTAEVEAALGQPVAANLITSFHCDYTTTDAGDMARLVLTLAGPFEFQAERFEEIIEQSVGDVGPGFRTQQIDGPGDSAVLATAMVDAVPVSVLHVLADDMWLQVSLIPANRSDWSAETLTQLADLALQRLP